MNFAAWLYGKSTHPKRREALHTLSALALTVTYSPISLAYFIIDSQGNLQKILNTKVEVIKYLADL